jgi:FAD/FMN-containing dehydrogenase
MTPPLSRRRLLSHASLLALAQLTSCAGLKRPVGQATAGGAIPTPDWDSLDKALRGTLLQPGDSSFAGRSESWNKRYDHRQPAALAQCKSIDDIRTCIQWATQRDVPIVARSGGHSYAGYSTTQGLLIDISGLNGEPGFDPNTGYMRVDGGAINDTLYKALPSKRRAVTHGRCAVTHGRCKSVGVGGLVLGGGVGFNMRAHGLLIDQLVSTDILLADGSMKTCSATSNPDLFWALRGGGGGNFGINTSFTFRTFEVDQVTVCNITWRDQLDRLLPVMLERIPQATQAFGSKLSVVHHSQKGMSINLLGQLHGPRSQLDAILKEFNAISNPYDLSIVSDDYWKEQPSFLGEDSKREFSHERSSFAFPTLNEPALARTILENMRKWPGTHELTTWKAFFTGGQIDKVRNHETAYSHRGASMLTSVELNWESKDSQESLDKNEEWLTRFHRELQDHTSSQCYQNFIDDSQTDYLRAYYGENLSRLVDVKRAVDPRNVFTYKQGIPVRRA